MSVIAGIVDLDGGPVARADLERMGRAVKAFARDDLRIETGPGFGLLSGITRFTPEDRLERQPVAFGRGERLLFDGRIDNREALARGLGIGATELAGLSDSALVGRVWEHRGRDCLGDLVGIFCLAHWAPEARRLTLVRGPARGRPLAVHQAGSRLYFASAPQALFALPEVPREVDEAALADILLKNDGVGDALYRGLEMVRNAHWLAFAPGRRDLGRYWRVDPERRLEFRREEDAWEAFAALFEEVTRSQLRTIHPVGIRMSGGLDSAAVAGQAARLLAERGETLHGYTRVPAVDASLPPDSNDYHDERARVGLVAAMYPNLRTNFVVTGEAPFFAELDTWLAARQHLEPLPPTHITGNLLLHRRAMQDGVRVLLNGTGGNLTFSHNGYSRIRELLATGHWVTLAHELRALKRFRRGRYSMLGAIKAESLELLMPRGLRLAYHRWRNRGGPPWAHYSMIHPDFARQSGALERLRAKTNIKLFWSGLNGLERRLMHLDRTSYTLADGVQAVYGIDARDPTIDRRVIEFCFALPESYYLRDGIERRFARLGTAHLIPEAIRLDPTHGLQDTDWAYRTGQSRAEVDAAIQRLADDPDARRYLDVARMQALWRRFEDIDWSRASSAEQIRFTQGLLGGLAMGEFIRWVEGRN